MSENVTFDFPSDRHYDATRHMWARKDDQLGRIIVGIDALGLDSLGELAYVAFRDIGTRVEIGEAVGSLEAAKMTTEIYSPISGLLVEVNEEATRNPGLVNEDPYGKGWLVALEPTGWERESGHMISGDQLPGWVKAEIERYEAESPLGQ